MEQEEKELLFGLAAEIGMSFYARETSDVSKQEAESQIKRLLPHSWAAHSLRGRDEAADTDEAWKGGRKRDKERKEEEKMELEKRKREKKRRQMLLEEADAPAAAGNYTGICASNDCIHLLLLLANMA